MYIYTLQKVVSEMLCVSLGLEDPSVTHLHRGLLLFVHERELFMCRYFVLLCGYFGSQHCGLFEAPSLVQSNQLGSAASLDTVLPFCIKKRVSSAAGRYTFFLACNTVFLLLC